jgi:hypothetical protein
MRLKAEAAQVSAETINAVSFAVSMKGFPE